MSVEVKKIANKDINLPLLTEEIAATIVPAYGLLMAGFTFNRGDGLYKPNGRATIISTRSDGQGGTINDIAAIAELRFTTRNALTGPEDTALDGALTAHVATVKTSEQDNKAQDAIDADQLLVDYGNWDGMTAAQRDATTKIMLRLQTRKLLGPNADI